MPKKVKDKAAKSRVLLEGRVPKAWLVGVVVALAVLFVGAIIAFSAVNHLTTCETCHLIQPEVTAYKKTAHYRAGVGCQKCHTKPGVFNYLIRNLQGLTNLMLYATNTYERPLTTAVGTNNCVQCHPKSQLERDQVFGNIRVNHSGLREAGYQCTTCHADISHPGTQLEVARVSQNKMPICARCHDGVKLSDDCSICHVGGAPPENINVAMTGKITPQQCKGCHTKGKSGGAICADCHNGLEMPHPAHWVKKHGAIVVDRGKSICASCHTKKDPKFCIDCHGLEMPHPAGWSTSHGGFSLQDGNRKKCVKCHGDNSCFKCHGLQMPHPSGWLSQHTSVALSNPSLCNKCHTSSFCFACHGVELPHSSAFIADHPNHVYSSGSICMKCHGNGGTGPRGCYGGQCHAGSISKP